MTFGEALEALKNGAKIAREGWNGKGMHLELEEWKGLELMYEPCIVMYTAQGYWQPGWLASQPDMLSNDWVIL